MASTSLTHHAPVPFLDLRHVHDGLKSRLLAEMSDLIDANAFTNGAQVAEFERAFASTAAPNTLRRAGEWPRRACDSR